MSILQKRNLFNRISYIPPIGCDSRTSKQILPPKTQKLPGTASAIFGGSRAGKFREVREVWRERKPPFKGVPLPPRSFPQNNLYFKRRLSAIIAMNSLLVGLPLPC